LDLLVAEVLKRNPSIPAMVAAWQAAAQRYPQVISLDDPMFGAMLGPGTFGSSDVDFGWMLEASQKVPWPGKRPLRGRVAQAEADAAFQEIEDSRLRLAEAAKLAFFDYFLVRRELEINADNVRIMQEFRNIAQTKYESNLVPQQDVLQAEVDLADLARRRVELERMDEVARARINTLLHRVPDHALPAPPQQIDLADGLPPAETLRQLALERRPDLTAQAARIRAEEAALELACNEFYPDLEFIARYDSFWQPAERDLRPQVGVNLNLPIQRDRRRAAVAEAIAKITQRRAELEQRIDEIQNDVQASIARVNEAKRVVALYNDSILPAAQKNIESAQAGYVSGRVDFLRLIEAQRQLISYREKQYEAVAEYHRRLAELERVLAGPIAQ
jgi:outer membrane protein TolC